MTDILNDIFYGGYVPVTEQVYHCRKVEALRRDLEKKEDALMKQLPENQQRLLWELLESRSDLLYCMSEECFNRGFKLAVQMILAGCDNGGPKYQSFV